MYDPRDLLLARISDDVERAIGKVESAQLDRADDPHLGVAWDTLNELRIYVGELLERLHPEDAGDKLMAAARGK